MLLLQDVKHYFLSELSERLQDTDIEVGDIIFEVADNNIPVYYSDLLSIASMNLWLAVEKPEIPAETAVQAISYNLYDYLVEL